MNLLPHLLRWLCTLALENTAQGAAQAAFLVCDVNRT